MNRAAYTATVVSRPALLVGLAAGVIAAVAIRVAGAPVWSSVLVVIVVALTSVACSTVRVAVGDDRLVLGWASPPLRARSIPRAAVRQAWTVDLRWPQVFGLGIRPERRVTRLTVRAGPTVCLRLDSGELVRVSVPDPHAVVAALSVGNPTEPAPPSRRTP